MKTGEEFDEEEDKRTKEIMAKYMANFRAHRKGITPQEMADYYSQWADNLKYEQVTVAIMFVLSCKLTIIHVDNYFNINTCTFNIAKHSNTMYFLFSLYVLN